jgi:predicted DNA-binding mobile mystery protein A
MPRPKRWSEFAALEQKQLDATLRQAAGIASIETPRSGWIRSIRQALGMTAAQLAKRLRTSPQSVLALEKREAAGSITLATLEKAARALDCRMRVVFIPYHGIEETVHQRAMKRAREERDRIVHSMSLEGQNAGLHDAPDLDKIAVSWRTDRRTRLWDESES